MKPFYFVLAVLSILFGGLVLLPLLAWASLQDPRLTDADYCAAVLTTLLGTRAAGATLAGAAAVVLGLAAALYAVFLAGAGQRERKEALPMFWAALGLCSVAMFVLLLTINYFSLQAGEVTPISRWVDR